MITYIALIALMSANIFCADKAPLITCDFAQESDIPGILDLYEKASIHSNDKEKIVILPKEVREGATRKAIAKKRLFVARHGDTVVGFKKNYIVTDPSELQEILAQEFRFTENKTVSQRNICVDNKSCDDAPFTPVTYQFNQAPTHVYTGLSFTDPDHRNKGIHTQLSLHALAKILEHTNADKLSLIFGVTEPNIDRIPGNAKVFARAIQEKYKVSAPLTFTHYKTRAYMPQFTYENGKLIISSDDKSIPGFGNILTYSKENHD